MNVNQGYVSVELLWVLINGSGLIHYLSHMIFIFLGQSWMSANITTQNWPKKIKISNTFNKCQADMEKHPCSLEMLAEIHKS
jgi:hypothetical protein